MLHLFLKVIHQLQLVLLSKNSEDLWGQREEGGECIFHGLTYFCETSFQILVNYTIYNMKCVNDIDFLLFTNVEQSNCQLFFDW